VASPDDNPFAPPSEAAELVERDDSKDEGPLTNAPLNARFVNFLVDSVCIYALSTSSAALFALADFKLAGAAALLVSVSARLTYLPFFEYVFNKTPGKWLTRTRVVRVDGGRPRFMQILGRTLARYVPFEPFSFFGSSHSGWHDTWSGTRVVKDTR